MLNKIKKDKEIEVVKKRLVKNYNSLKSSLKILYLHAERYLQDGEGISFSFDDDLFSFKCDIRIYIEDIIPFCELEPISGSCIAVFICHLYKLMEENNKLDAVRFVDPFSVSYIPKQSPDERARYLYQGIENISINQLAIVPVNVGLHWILTVIDPHKESAYMLDPLCHRLRDDNWVQTVNKALVMFNAKIGRRGKKKPQWEVVKGPIQPDDKQCGFFVMRFMKEIIDEIVVGGTISLKSHFDNRKYSQEDVDEVRYAWADFVLEQI